ncbi:Adenylate cyclase (EC / Guanylate cyclase (EC [Olavius algarvensis associated proteobacterium Delta 3]|nr:Adenylate cyclase (EC / Guanylate cyclase (EC [Olavius algarvensis associated proteobacterium Delta 3]CAB5151396.1 Adenylate cyclase (EC / Guanylate cyclase (EC [Olavius algarvensis associated proteobacterium Delta 3]
MKCPSCQFRNSAGAKFCNECGFKLESACPNCGNINPAGSKFCNECGQRLSRDGEVPPTQSEVASLNHTEGERRHATILFSDVSGYTSMNETLDPEEVETIMHRIKREAINIVERHGGIVNQFVGDEVLALFGIPTAHEDDPVRAVRAAIDIHSLVRRLSSEVEDRIGTKLRMHTGINTGLVVSHMRDTRNGTYGITGDAVNTGARLAALADTDDILVGPETHDLIAPYFETEPREVATLKGKARPTACYRVSKESAVRTRFEAARAHGLTHFTGRAGELASLYSCLEKTLSGEGQLVTVVGEAGLGKSRLIYEFRHSLNRSQVTVLQGRCQSYGTSTPYFPHINAFRRGLNLSETDTPAQLHEKTIANILAIDPSLEKFLPVYLHLLSIPSEAYPLPENLHGRELTLAIQEALTASFIFNSNRTPMVLMFEDWHWADDASDGLIKHMVSLIASHPMLLLVIYRPDYTASWGNWSHHTPLILNAMDRQNCGDIVKSVWHVSELPEEMVGLIHDQTGGNPFFVEEISRTLMEEGAIKNENSKAVLTRSLKKLSLPNTVEAVIRSRLDRLDRHSQDSLRLASVIGLEFARRILEQITTSQERLSNSLENLKLLELIQQTQVVPEAEYMFKHAITQEVTYETLLKQKRKELHAIVGRAIEELYAERLEEYYEMLAYHFRRGEDWDKAFRYNREAGLKAQALSAYIEAQQFLEVALDALKKLPGSRARVEQEIDLRFNMRSALFPLGRHDDWADHVRVAESLAKQIEDKHRLANSYVYLSGHHWIRGRHQDAISLGEESVLLAKSLRNFSVEVTAKLHLGIPLLYTGQIERQTAVHREVAEQLSGAEALKRHGLTTVPAITTRGYLAWGLAELGEFEEAQMWAGEGIELSGKVKNFLTTGFVKASAGLAFLRKGHLNIALRLLSEAFTLSRNADLQSIFSFAAGSLGNAYLLSGRPEAALPILIEAVDRHYLNSSIIPPIYTITVLSEVYRRLGQIRDAAEACDKAVRLLEQNGERCFGAWALFTHAKIQSEQNRNRVETAEHAFWDAMKSAKELKMKPLMAHCHLELGRLYLRATREGARKEFEHAIDIYRSLRMRFWLPEAEELLRRTG